MSDQQTSICVEVTETELDKVEGGLLPAVQKVREAANRTDIPATESLSLNFTKVTY